VTALLRERDIPFAVIGAAALAVHGVTRSTRDLDLLTLAQDCLTDSFWRPLGASDIEATIQRGDADDPLAGVVRLTARGEHPLDLIVGRSAWQRAILERARETPIDGVPVPVAGRADVIVLKLYAGGPQDAWDITQLLEIPERAALLAEVERALPALPAESRQLWARIVR
jgi:predicted nucleotidyltransferase